MVAQTVTNQMSKTQVQRFANMQKNAAGSALVNISGNTTTTITIVYTTSGDVITIDYAST